VVDKAASMKFKGTLWMAVLLLGIVLYYYLVDIPAEKKEIEEKERAGKILLFEKDQVEAFVLEKKDSVFHLKRNRPNDWELVKPVQAKADSGTVSSFLSFLDSARFSRVVEDSAKDLSVYGLEDPSMKITLQLQGKGEKTLLIGDDHPMNKNLYVKREDDSKVLLAGDSREALDKSLFDFRDKGLLQFKAEEVEGVNFLSDGESFALSKQGGKWKIIGPEKTKADADEIKNFLKLVGKFKVKKFLDESPDSLAPYGLDRPKARLTLKAGKEAGGLTLLVGDRLGSEGYYGKVENAQNVVLFGNQLVKTLTKKTVDFMPKTLLEFKQTDVSKIHLKTGDEKISLVRTDDGGWKITEPIEANSDLSTVNSLLFDLKAARVQAYVKTPMQDPELFGLDLASKVLTVDFEEGESWTLELGNETSDGQNYFGRRAGEAMIFTLSADTIGKLFRSLHDLKNKKLLNFEKDAVQKISVAYPDIAFELEKSDEEWSLTKPEKIKTIQGFIGKDILWSLNTLEYESIVQPLFADNDFGLSQPNVTVTLWAGDDSKAAGKVIVGAKVENKPEYYARVDGSSDLYTIKALFLDSLPKVLQKFKNP
jgi:hypothetical protein